MSVSFLKPNKRFDEDLYCWWVWLWKIIRCHRFLPDIFTFDWKWSCSLGLSSMASDQHQGSRMSSNACRATILIAIQSFGTGASFRQSLNTNKRSTFKYLSSPNLWEDSWITLCKKAVNVCTIFQASLNLENRSKVYQLNSSAVWNENTLFSFHTNAVFFIVISKSSRLYLLCICIVGVLQEYEYSPY